MLGSQSIVGISSGLDTSAIVDAIIQFERRNAVVLEAQQANKTNIVNSFKALQARLLALSSNISFLTRAGTFTKTTVNISDNNVLRATASGRVATGSYDIEVMDLARQHQIASQGFADVDSVTLGTGTISMSVGSGANFTFTLDDTNNTLMGLKKAINDSSADVTASIINDGSSSNPFRLLLSSDKTGLASKITLSSTLTGGTSPNFLTSSFDVPEILTQGATSSSTISLGSTAAYSGSTNKIYTFTVAGTGEQTVGTDNITINYTDGTNSGSIIVTQADNEVTLVGTGSDGLKLSFSSGLMTAGDTFQVQTFAPILQEATDAKIGFGSTGGNGSPIVVTSASNEFKEVIAGLTLSVKKVTLPGETINIIADIDFEGIRETIKQFVTSYNDVMDFIDKQNSFDSETEQGGILLGDLTLQRAQNQIRRALGSSISGLSKSFNQIFSVGLRTNPDGKLILRDTAKFDEAIRENLDDVIKLFGDSATSTNSRIEYISQTADTKVGDNYKVDISTVATQGRFQGSEIDDPAIVPLTLTSTTNKLKFRLSGLVSDEFAMTAKTYNTGAELASELQKQIDADKKIGDRELTVVWVTTSGGKGHLLFTTGDYGSRAELVNEFSIGNSAFSALGLAIGQSFAGKDVAGTINGEKATGSGQFLTGDDDNKTTDGLKLKITIDANQLKGAEEGSISIMKGVAIRLQDLVGSITRSGDGLLDSRIKSEQKQIQNIKSRIEQIDANLLRRRDRLTAQFLEMEAALGAFNTQSQFLSIQFANINSNFNFNNR